MNSPLDVNKGFTESRTTLTMVAGEKHFIEDITSTETQIVDDLNKVKEVLEEMVKQKGSYNSNFKDLNALIKWFKLEGDEKNN